MQSPGRLSSVEHEQSELDLNYNPVGLLGFQRAARRDGVLVADGEYVVVPMTLSREWIQGLWAKIQHYKALFWEPKHSELENFIAIITQPGWLFFEVYKDGYLVGLVYFTDVDSLSGVQMHGVMFDRKLTDKAPLAKKLLAWLFENYPINRVEVLIGAKFFATTRFLSTIGFKHEGIRRRAMLHKHKWIDQALYGILREEV